jgi:hypothetical protein
MMSHKRITIALFIFVFLIIPITTSFGFTEKSFTTSQDDGSNLFMDQLLDQGAELLVANIDSEGEAEVIYGQLGLPTTALSMDDDMYDNCILMALVATRGELLDYVFSWATGGLFAGPGNGENGDGIGGGGTGFSLAQDGNPLGGITNYLGSDFRLLITSFINLDAISVLEQSLQIQTHLTSQFGFTFSQLFSMRVDESSLPSDVELPFTSLDLLIHYVESDFENALSSILDGVGNDDGILSSLDSTIFSSATSSAAAIFAIPDIEELLSTFGDMSGGEPEPQPGFFLSQMEGLTGSIALATIGYVGDQVLSYGSTEVGLSELIGEPTTIGSFDDGFSMAVINLPDDVNITDYSPVGVNQSAYDNETQSVFWNASSFGDQDDYVVNFESGKFPPMVTLERAFTPEVSTIGSTVTVTVTLVNGDDGPLSDIQILDDGFLDFYPDLEVTGPLTKSVTSLGVSETTDLSYEVTFAYEGAYTFPGALVNFTFGGEAFTKSFPKMSYVVAADLGSVLSQSGPYTLAFAGVIVLGAIFNLRGLFRRD